MQRVTDPSVARVALEDAHIVPQQVYMLQADTKRQTEGLTDRRMLNHVEED